MVMKGGVIRRFFVNLVCGIIPNKDKRKKARVVMNSNMVGYLRFIHKNIGAPITKVKTFVGYQARNLIIGVNNKWVFKFPLRRDDSNELALREKRIVDALAPFSPVAIPDVEIYKYRGCVVRRYEYIQGSTLRGLPTHAVMQNMDKLASQVARFMYDIAMADPEQILDLKPAPDMQPGYMCGWCQGDICDNFMVNPDTMDVIAFIDWEDAKFFDFSHLFHAEKRSPAREFMLAVEREYKKLYGKK